MGKWVAARCRKRAKVHKKGMPQFVKDWLDTGGNSPADENTAPTTAVRNWVVNTLEDPDWPES